MIILGFNPNTIDPGCGMNVIHKGVASRNQIALDGFLHSYNSISLNIQVEEGYFDEMTPLHIAIISKEINLVESLCQYNGDVITDLEFQTKDGKTTIELAQEYKLKSVGDKSKSGRNLV